ncbi:hypothetical protein ACETK8_17200 [Brevundimonas staleyi]|uniref:Uncharacterized protein n=1 Tax=Brevundimonas staleyi TaxID=74326 RepID=A0ABW0FRU9_9CAUL
MTTREPTPYAGSRTLQTAHLVLAALAAIVIAVASQGWPSSGDRCEPGSVCDGV